jgi:hypothetical protein
MAIDSSSRTAADLDVPEFLRPDYVPTKPAAPAVTATRPAPRTTQSAALVVAKATGRGLGHTARAAGTGGGWLGRGLHGTTRAGWRYVRAADRVESVQPSSHESWDKIREERHRRWIAAAGTAGGGVVLTVAASLGLVLGVGVPAGEAFLLAPAAETTIAGAIVTEYGRRIANRRELGAAPAAPAISGGAPALDASGAPLSPADDVLLKALADIKVPDGFRIVASNPGRDGTSVTIVDLPANFTVTSLKAKAEELAGALGRDVTMVDITKAAHANQAAIWLSAVDPFEAARPSPLMDLRLAVDAFLDGVPVAWGKRGNPVLLPINNSSFVVGGGTRSGKGVGAANLVTGAAFDPRINLRIVAGKNNGEWDPAAKAGVAATYFKPDPHRLNALLKALWEDKDRRERILGKAGKSKMTAATIMELGGIELLVIDEVATYTRPGNVLRDENLKLLTDLSAVAAAAGILMVLITQYPEVAVIPQALAMNCTTRWAMRVENATQSNAILGEGSSGAGRDASKFDPPRPGLGWLINPFAGVTDLARSFDLDEDDRGEVSELMARAAKIRSAAGRLTGQWDDPIERALAEATGMSSAAGGPDHNGVPARLLHLLDPQQAAAFDALTDCVQVMDDLGRDAQVDEMAAKLAMPAERLSELLRAAGAGPTGKIWVTDADGKRNRVNGYQRDHLRALLAQAKSA